MIYIVTANHNNWLSHIRTVIFPITPINPNRKDTNMVIMPKS